MLQKIQIKGYKSIKELELELRPINILIGANGVGKSNFISFFKLVNNIYEQRLENFSLKAGVENLLHYGSKETEEVFGRLTFRRHEYTNEYSFILQPTENKSNLFIQDEDSIFEGDPTYPGINNVKESVIKDSPYKRNVHLRKYLESYKIYHFHDTSSSAPLRLPCSLDDNHNLKEDGANLPAFLYYLQEKHPISFKRIQQIIASTVPFFEKFNLSPDRLDETRIKLEWIEKNHPDSYFNASHLSDGSLRFIALTILLMQPNLPKIIIIDEPELGLHPTAINKLSGMIKSVSQQDCQVIISTQSINLVDNFEPEDIVTVDRFEDQSVFHRLEKENLQTWLEDYSLGDLWQKNIIKGQI
jgi:predicted ATPase